MPFNLPAGSFRLWARAVEAAPDEDEEIGEDKPNDDDTAPGDLGEEESDSERE
jgi:hypothetical protein